VLALYDQQAPRIEAESEVLTTLRPRSRPAPALARVS